MGKFGKAILKITLLLCIALTCVACGGNTQANTQDTSSEKNSMTENTSEVESESESQMEAETETGSDTEVAVLDPNLLAAIEVEAGTESIATESFFSEYTGQVLTISNPLTAEELCAVGSSYELKVVCNGVESSVTVKIVDTTAPVISGATDKNIEWGSTVAYRKNVSVTDNSGEKITLEIDSSQVQKAVAGTYVVTYSATDSSGNTATVQINVNISEKPELTEEFVRPYVEEVVNQVVTADMSDWDKAYALYYWVKENVRYSGNGVNGTIWEGAYEAIKLGTGDCYTFSAAYGALLTVAGIDNMYVRRVGGLTDHRWNLVNLGDGWYHCDSSPRRKGDGYICFMQTDEQVYAYTETYPEKPNYFVFDTTLYPERETTIVFGDEPDVIIENGAVFNEN